MSTTYHSICRCLRPAIKLSLRFDELKQRWLQHPAFRAAYDAIEDPLEGVEIHAHTWNYRVIEFDGTDGEPWRAIHEVHYRNGQPAAYSDTPAGIVWHPTADGWEDPRALLERLASALDKPILTPADFPAEA